MRAEKEELTILSSSASPLSKALDEHAKLIEILDATLGEMENRLRPLLREPGPPSPERTSLESQPCGPMVAQLINWNARLTSMGDHVRDLLGRLDA